MSSGPGSSVRMTNPLDTPLSDSGEEEGGEEEDAELGLAGRVKGGDGHISPARGMEGKDEPLLISASSDQLAGADAVVPEGRGVFWMDQVHSILPVPHPRPRCFVPAQPDVLRVGQMFSFHADEHSHEFVLTLHDAADPTGAPLGSVAVPLKKEVQTKQGTTLSSHHHLTS